MDESTSKGFSPKYVAEQVLTSVLRGQKEITVADPLAKVAMFLRNFMPSLYFWVMQFRAKSHKKKDA